MAVGAAGNRPMTAPETRTGDTTTKTPEQYPSLSPDYKISEHMRGDGKLNLDDATMPPAYGAFLSAMGEESAKAVAARVETKMGEWVKANPNATNAQFTDQLQKTLQVQSLIQQELKNSISKMMNDLFAKMKEMNADRFG